MGAEIQKPVDFDELYPGRFLKAGLFKGKPVTLDITAVHMEELEGEKGPQQRGIVSFRQTDKQWVLNKINGECLKEMWGRKVQEWIGHRVTLYPGTWQGKPAIRVWGSPELSEDRPLTIELPKRKPMQVVLHAVRKAGPKQTTSGAADPMDPEPGSNDEPF
jgi:hypothetical protein